MLSDRHPTKDFFVLDLSDVSPKDDMTTMTHPVFSLATKPDFRHLTYEIGPHRVELLPGAQGLPTIFDKDILIYAISQQVERKNRGLEIGKRVRMTAHEVLVATNRHTNDRGYKRLGEAISRLRGLTFRSNIFTEQQTMVWTYGLLDEGGFVVGETSTGKPRLEYIELVLSDFTMDAIEKMEVLSIDRKYFRLRRPLERRLYELARKFCGDQDAWRVSLSNLQQRTGSSASINKFRFNLRQIIEDDHTPTYKFRLTPKDQVIVKPRKTTTKQQAPDLEIPQWAVEQAQQIAVEKGWDYYALEREWQDFAKAKGEPIKNAGGAFLNFCKKKPKLR